MAHISRHDGCPPAPFPQFAAICDGMRHAPPSRMSTTRSLSLALLKVASIGVLGALVACTSSTTATGPDTHDGASGDAASGDAPSGDATSDDAARNLDTGGALVAPFKCQTDAIQGEPRPGVPLLEELRIAAGLDALQERRAVAAGLDAGIQPGVRAGVPCSGSTDHDACETAFAQLSSGGEALRPAFDEIDYSFGGEAGPPGYYLAYTKGDAVGKVSNRAELRTLFPTIDTPAKALLYANASGYRVECQRAGGWLREEADGWVLLASRGHEKRCSRTDVVLFVRLDGTTVERDVIENQPDACT